MNRPLVRLCCGFLLLAGLAACSKHDHADHASEHAHVAPHGGTLVEIGEHEFNLELVRDAADGTLTIYALDGHAENFVRLAMPGFEATAIVGNERHRLVFAAVGNPMTGESIGDTSAFVTQADWLKAADHFTGTIAEITLRGATYREVKFSFPESVK